MDSIYPSQNKEERKFLVVKLINHWLSQNPGSFLSSRIIIAFAAGRKRAGKRPLRRHER